MCHIRPDIRRTVTMFHTSKCTIVRVKLGMGIMGVEYTICFQIAPNPDRQASSCKEFNHGIGDAIESRKELQEPLYIPETVLSQLYPGFVGIISEKKKNPFNESSGRGDTFMDVDELTNQRLVRLLR